MRHPETRPSKAVRTILLSITVGLTQSAMAAVAFPPQHIRFLQLGIEQGLSQSSVQAIAQDRAGYLWFGTENGLNRFDGYSFTVFRQDPADSFSLSDNYIWRLLSSGTGDLWIGTLEGGLDRYEVSTGRFITYRNDANDSTSLSSNNVTGLCEDKNGTLWVGTWGGGLCRLERGARTFVRYRHLPNVPNSLGSNFVSSIREDKDGDLWAGTWHGLTRIDPSRTRFTRYVHSPDDGRTLSDNMVWDLLIDRNNDLWIATRGGLNKYERAGDRFVRFTHDARVPETLSSNSISCLLEDSRGLFWVGTYEAGLNRLDRSSTRVTHYRFTEDAAQAVHHDDVLAVFEDRVGALWFGTSHGISTYDPGAERFHVVDLGNLPTHSGRNVRSINESHEGGIWLGTNGSGLLRIPRELHGRGTFKAADKYPGNLSSANVLSVLEQRNGTLWVGTLHGLNRMASGGNRSVRYFADPGDPNALSDNAVISLLEDRDGTVWVGTNGGGLESYEPNADRFIHHTHTPLAGSISGNWIWAIFEDQAGNLWVGTWTQGLNRYDRGTNSFTVFVHDPADTNSLSNNTVLCIQEDTDGVLWIGTLGGGLNRFDPTTQRFSHYSEKDGLCSDVVVGILPDGKGNLWLSTYRGISRFTPRTGRFKNFDVSDGLQSNEFNQGAFCRLRDGSMLFGGVAGLNFFVPDSINDNPFVPPVVISSFKVFEEPIRLPIPTGSIDCVHLSFRQNFFSLEFAALNFRSPHKNQYSYLLEGMDRQWVDAGSRRVAYYTNVPPGTYVFHVKGANNDGVWNREGAQVTLVIDPPFWERTWFRVLLAALVLGILFSLYRLRMAQLRRKEQTQRAFSDQLLASQEQERSRIAGELHDSLVQNLLVAKNRSLIGMKKSADPSLVRRELKEIAGAVTLAIDEVREIAHNLRPYQLDRLGLTKAIQSLLATLQTSSGISFAAQIDPVDDIFPGDRSILLYRIVQEATNNILRHADASQASVSLQRTPAFVELVISDNGRGVQAETQRNPGFGLSGIAQRARMLDGRLTITSVPGKETKLHLSIPLKENGQ